MELTRHLGDRDIDEHKLNFAFHPSIYGDICLGFLNQADMAALLQRSSYVRVFCRQDEPESRAYIQCHIREVSRMLPAHLHEATIIFASVSDPNFVLLELNYVTRAHFFLIDVNTRKVLSGDHIIEWNEEQDRLETEHQMACR